MARLSCCLATLLIILLSWHRYLWLPMQNNHRLATTKINTTNSQVAELRRQLTNLESGAEANGTNPLKRDLKVTLRELMLSNHQLKLLELHSSSMDENDDTKKLGSHGLSIRFRGDYFSTLAYLKTVERLPCEIFWDKLEYQVISHPMAEILLHIHLINDR